MAYRLSLGLSVCSFILDYLVLTLMQFFKNGLGVGRHGFKWKTLLAEWKDKFAFNTNNQIVHTRVRVDSVVDQA
jgi:hypothetical protein